LRLSPTKRKCRLGEAGAVLAVMWELRDMARRSKRRHVAALHIEERSDEAA
jgi:hypothetical protein